MAADYVGDRETLFRRIPQGMGLYESLPDGSVRFHSPAFADRLKWRPSVDRERLCPTGPAHTQQHGSDGVASVSTYDVRHIQGITQNDRRGVAIARFDVGVTPAPIGPGDPDGLPENPAHAEIHTSPTCPDDTVHRKLCKRLALLASQRPWAIPPEDLRGK